MRRTISSRINYYRYKYSAEQQLTTDRCQQMHPIAILVLFFMHTIAIADQCKMKNVTYSEFSLDINASLIVNIDFIPQIEKINNYAKNASVQILITSSFRRDTNVTGKSDSYQSLVEIMYIFRCYCTAGNPFESHGWTCN